VTRKQVSIHEAHYDFTISDRHSYFYKHVSGNGYFTDNQILNNVHLGATTSPPFLWSFLRDFERSLIAGSDDLDSWNFAPQNDIDVHPRRLGFVNDDITIQHCFSNHQLISQYHVKDVLDIHLSFIFLRNTLQVNFH